MDRLNFENISELAEYMGNYVTVNSSKDEYPIISVYANYEIAKELVENLIAFGNNIGSILELESYEMSHYDKEYCVYLTEDGVTCEKEYHENRYYNGGGDISFVHEDCNSKLLSHIDSNTIYEFGFNNDDECCCDECECACQKDEKPATTSKESYFINGKSVDKSEFDKKYEEFEEKYINNIQDMLLNHFEFLDEMNQWRKLLGW